MYNVIKKEKREILKKHRAAELSMIFEERVYHGFTVGDSFDILKSLAQECENSDVAKMHSRETIRWFSSKFSVRNEWKILETFPRVVGV